MQQKGKEEVERERLSNIIPCLHPSYIAALLVPAGQYCIVKLRCIVTLITNNYSMFELQCDFYIRIFLFTFGFLWIKFGDTDGIPAVSLPLAK